MHYNYLSQVDAIDDLRKRGYSEDFRLKPDCLECASMQLDIYPDDFEITEVYRFEGMNDPGDSSVLYAIEGKNGIKGVLTDAYGVYADSLTSDMLEKLRVKH